MKIRKFSAMNQRYHQVRSLDPRMRGAIIHDGSLFKSQFQKLRHDGQLCVQHATTTASSNQEFLPKWTLFTTMASSQGTKMKWTT
jgi:hypothetical protein